jgi:5'-nucleotidase
MDQTAYGGADPYAAPVGSNYQQDAYPTYGSPAATEPAYTAPAATTASIDVSGKRTHTVVKKDTLYCLARQYYGDASRWKDIYEANRSKISDPNRIRVGDKLVIP